MRNVAITAFHRIRSKQSRRIARRCMTCRVVGFFRFARGPFRVRRRPPDERGVRILLNIYYSGRDVRTIIIYDETTENPPRPPFACRKKKESSKFYRRVRFEDIF